jgi:NADH-quinone oxidoreductase subunit B
MSFIDFSRAKSLWVINYFNSCGFMELLPWVSSGYDMERFGILPTASARHAVLALGSCPMTGGMYWDSYNTVKNIEEVVPVDVWVLGCPPKPENIGHGIVMAMKAIEGGFKGH